MKKLIAMAAVAAASMVVSAQTLIVCGEKSTVEEGCDAIAFKLTASGKTVTVGELKDGTEYKTVSALKISKGYLVLVAGEAGGDDNSDTNSATGGEGSDDTNSEEEVESGCCYDSANLYAIVKAGKVKFNLALQELEVGKWSIFGKNLDKALNQTNMKPGSSVSLETDLFVSAEDAENAIEDEEVEATAINFYASSFGTMKYSLSKATKGTTGCNPTEPTAGCEPILTWKTYCGWFAGNFAAISDAQACATCDCPDIDIFGGTWKAVYAKAIKTDAAAQKATFGKVLVEGDAE